MVIVNSGQLPTARGVDEGYDLSLVIRKWQAISSGRFRNDCRDLLQMIDETDELRLWEKNVGGFTYESRDDFLQRKVLIDYDLTETALHDIVGKLKSGDSAGASSAFDKRAREHEEWSARHEAGESYRKIAESDGTSKDTVQRRVSQKPVKHTESETPKRTNNRQLYLSINAADAAAKIREKFGEEFADALKAEL